MQFWLSLSGETAHKDCLRGLAEAKEAQERREAQAKRQREELDRQQLRQHVERGEFRSLNDQAEMILDERETCCIIVRGCFRANFYPRMAGQRGRPVRGSTLGEWRVDGLVRRDRGTLHVTDRRLCFLGLGGATSIPIKKVVQCQAMNDALKILAEGRQSASYFILEPGPALEVFASAIAKLAELARSKRSITLIS